MDRNAFRLWLKPDPAGIETCAQWHLHPFPELYDLIRANETALAAPEPYQAWLTTFADQLDDRTASEGPRRTREVFRSN